MSKSLKNFITIREAVNDHKVTARQMRLLFLSFEWHKNMSFSTQSIDEAREKERVLRAFFGDVEVILRGDWLAGPQTFTPLDSDLVEKWKVATDAVHQALCTNMNTPVALNALMALVAQANAYIRATQAPTSEQPPSATLLKKVALYVTKMFRVFGVVETNDAIGFGDAGAGDAAADARLNAAMDALLRLRDECRKATREGKDAKSLMAFCDYVRDDILPPAGIRVEDKPGAAVWKRDDAETLLREISERRAAVEVERKKKLANQVETQKKLLAKWEKVEAAPVDYFQKDPKESIKYSQYDVTGVPTHDKEGAALDDKKKAKLATELKKYDGQHAELQAKGGAAFMSQLRSEIASMVSQLE
jgi:cysteinyl-tRNA synthetase